MSVSRPQHATLVTGASSVVVAKDKIPSLMWPLVALLQAAGYTRPHHQNCAAAAAAPPAQKLVTRKGGVSEAGNAASLCPLQKFNLTRFLIGRAAGGRAVACAVIITGVALGNLGWASQLKLLADIIAR
jgi:hypothetical protein